MGWGTGAGGRLELQGGWLAQAGAHPGAPAALPPRAARRRVRCRCHCHCHVPRALQIIAQALGAAKSRNSKISNYVSCPSSVTTCGPGTGMAASSCSQCAPCPPGTYNNGSTSTSCLPCGPHTYSGAPGAARCQVCGPNEVSLKTLGSTGCRSCGALYQSDNACV